MNRQIVATAFMALILGAASGYWLALNQGEVMRAPTPRAADSHRNPLFYRNPMNSEITSPVPAKDSMGMDYVPVYAQENQDNAPPGTVKIDPVTRQNIGVRTAHARTETLSRDIRTVGLVDYDEELMTRLHPKIEGWIDKLFIDKTGEQVMKGTILLSVYSPQLVTSEQEYLLALDNVQALGNSPYPDIRGGADAMVKSSRARLEFLDVPEHQIRELERTRQIMKSLHIHSPFKGVILNIGAREGQYVTPDTELYTIADLSRVWVYADVYQDELPWIRAGDAVDMELNAAPGHLFKGHVVYIYPYAEAKTRTIKVRLEFENSDLLLKPDMFANVIVHASRQVNAVVIPSEAVVRSGLHDRVFLARGDGRFEPREVRVGLSANGMVQVLTGVAPGDVVVTSAEFLIDSESKLREAAEKMREPATNENPAGSVRPPDPVPETGNSQP